MVNAQKWLDKNYSKTNRNKVTEIYLNEPSLEGKLDLSDFTWNWGRGNSGIIVYISLLVDETKIAIKNLPKEARIVKLTSIQKYIDQLHPSKEKRKELTKLDINWKNLEGAWDLSDFINLKSLNCYGNKLIFLNLNSCSQLEEIECSQNQLANLDVSNCSYLNELNCHNNLLTNISLPSNPVNLKEIWLSNNNFSSQDLSFLVPYTNLEGLRLGNNCFAGSLDFLSEMKNLKELDISNTDINEVDVYKLPRRLRKVSYSTKFRPNCKLTTIVPQLEKYKYGFCHKCTQPNASFEWCQSCADKEWEQDLEKLSGQKLIEKFIQQQQSKEAIYINGTTYLTELEFRKLNEDRKLKWIPYEQFTNIEYLATGGFSKICKAKWQGKESEKRNSEEKRPEKVNYTEVILKSLNNSQKITREFLTEIANNCLVNGVVHCHGISQDPETKNYMIVMDYMNQGDLRKYLQNNVNDLSFNIKLYKLSNITSILSEIHNQGLIHNDFHLGNILNYITVNGHTESLITDLGLSQLANYQKQESEKIFGVLPYVAPEVLMGQPYTQKSDIYSLGIVAYELFANAYPYYDLKLDNTSLISKIHKGLRPNIGRLKIPQSLKNLIKGWWDADPKKRHIGFWQDDKDLYREYEKKETKEYDNFSQNTPYQIHSNAIIYSQPINTQEIARLFQESQEQALELELKKIEQEINQSLTEEQKELISNFIKARKKMIADPNDKETKEKALNLEDELLDEKGFSEENIEKIIDYCKRLTIEQEKLQTNVEILTKTNF